MDYSHVNFNLRVFLREQQDVLRNIEYDLQHI
jgi:hypothetical protein